jgi:hypothetical protein
VPAVPATPAAHAVPAAPAVPAARTNGLPADGPAAHGMGEGGAAPGRLLSVSPAQERPLWELLTRVGAVEAAGTLLRVEFETVFEYLAVRPRLRFRFRDQGFRPSPSLGRRWARCCALSSRPGGKMGAWVQNPRLEALAPGPSSTLALKHLIPHACKHARMRTRMFLTARIAKACQGPRPRSTCTHTCTHNAWHEHTHIPHACTHCTACAQHLRDVALELAPYGPRAMLYLAAAVSDFYVPWPELVRLSGLRVSSPAYNPGP